MKTRKPLHLALIALSMIAACAANATVLFSDNFNLGPSPRWGNERGSWSATGGAYRPAAPGNFPAAVSSLPFSLTDFSVDFDINSVSDGGIWLRSSAAPGTAVGFKGILLNLKPYYGIYWHIVSDGTTYGTDLNHVPFSSSNPHVHVEVSGNSYAAFLDGSSTPITTLTTSAFGSGGVALYDNSSQSFDNFVLQAVPEPAAGLLLLVGSILAFRRRSAS